MNAESSPPPEEGSIVEHVQYFNILMQSVQAINTSITNGADGRDAAENLLSDLPVDWSNEISEQIDIIITKYNKIVKENNKTFVTGTLGSLKVEAMKNIYYAGKEYSRSIKKTVISLLKKKDLLYQTKRKVEQGYLSLVALGEGDKEDD